MIMNCQRAFAGSLLLAMMATWCRAMPDQDRDGDNLPDLVEQKIGTPPDVAQRLVPIATSPRRDAAAAEPSAQPPDILALSGCHVGGDRVLLQVEFAQPPDFAAASLIVYLDMDNDPATGRVDRYHGGVDVMLVVSRNELNCSFHAERYQSRNTRTSAALQQRTLWITVDAPWVGQQDSIAFGVHLLAQIPDGPGDTTRHTIARLPISDAVPPALAVPRTNSLRSLADYRYHNDRVKYEKLSDKGLTGAQITPANPLVIPRPRPAVPFAAPRRRGTAGSLVRERVQVELLEEGQVDRRATPITFGFPVPQGGLFDTANMRLVNEAGQELPAQFTVTAFWPDDSLKWVLVDFQADLPAGQKSHLFMECGSAVHRTAATSPLQVTESEETLLVDTGAMRVAIDKRRFDLLHHVSLADRSVLVSSGTGVVLRDEHDHEYTQAGTPPRSVTVQQQGPQKVVLRIEGDYADAAGTTYMSYITRLHFRTGTTSVTIEHTHLNTYVKTEFTDVNSLVMPMQLAMPAERVEVLAADQHVDSATRPVGQPAARVTDAAQVPLTVTQWDDRHYVAGSRETEQVAGRYRGALGLHGQATAMQLAVHEFWQRWPKGIAVEQDRATVALLPAQPTPEFGRDLPFWLMFPFVEGKYRFKWGMAFTTRVTLDLGGRVPLEQLQADAGLPVIAVLPARWYAATGALGPLSAPVDGPLAAWDTYVAAAYQKHMAEKEQAREYGYFNYGDWYGERNRNWGNNEYDLAHGFFMQFARTGRRDYFRLALAAARHQADVDCVHAYPDPHYVGANHQHSIGHTGTWSQVPTHATWSHRYDSHTDARNGHTWTDGMMDAWYLVGEARVMEASLGVAEHIAWAMAPSFTQLGTHERSAGWALAAVLAVYRGTYDPAYLAAADQIAAVALREQKFDDGGAWPHVLPADHSGGHPGARGNNLFLMGVLLAGLKDYHEVTGDPATHKSLVSGARWVMKSWDREGRGWPYSASVTGESFYERITPSLNMLIVEGVAYAGSLTGDEQMLRTALDALRATAEESPPSSGKSVAQKLHFAASTMALLQDWLDAGKPFP